VSKKKLNPLVGKWFHSFKDEKICWQGQVISQIDETHYLVQLYDWIVGEPTNKRVVSIELVYGWQFHDTDQEMRDWAKDY
jgi:hypothetical protein